MSEISSINNIVNTVYRARGTQAIQESRLVAQGIGGIGRSLQQTSTLSDRFNSQWRAIGTTMRYAIAGSVIFGLASMVTQLKDVQQQLGLMQAIGSPGGRTFSNQAITQLGNSLQRSALDALTPINEVNDATVNLLSTVQNVPQSDIPTIITNIGQAAKLSQTPIEDLTKAATTMNIAFGRVNNAKSIAEFTRMWFGLIQEAPGGVSAAPEIANQLAPLSSMFALGKGPVSGRQSQAQMLGDVLAVLRTGSTPSTGLRGLTYLLQSIIQPTGGSRAALASIGITPQSIQNQGVQANLMKLLNSITHTGNQKQIAGMGDDQLSNLEDTGNLPGIPASEMIALRKMIPRIHGIRAAVILAGQLRSTNQTKSLQGSIELMNNEQNNEVNDVNNIARAWQDFRKRSRLQEAVVAINTMKLQVAQTFEPILNFASQGITGGVRVAQHHRTATQVALLGALSVGGALGIRRFLTGGVGTGIARGEAIRDIGSPGAGNSPENPLYVIVVGQLFNSGPTGTTRIPGGPRIPNTDMRDGEQATKDAKNIFRNKWFFGEVGAIAAGAGLVGTKKGRNFLYTPTSQVIGNLLGFDPTAKAGGQLQQMNRFPRIMQFFEAMRTPGMGPIDPNWQRMFRQFETGKISATQFNKALGRADVYMEIKVNQNGRVDTKRVHVPIDLWKNGPHPTTRGKKAVKNG